MLKKIGIFIVLAVVVVCGLALTKPDEFSMQRETTINKPREKVYALFNDFHNWGQWSPWEKLDPEMNASMESHNNTEFSMDEMVGHDFEAGLSNMKVDAEKPL